MSNAKTGSAKKKGILAAIWDSMTKTGGCCGPDGNCCGPAAPDAGKEGGARSEGRQEFGRIDQER